MNDQKGTEDVELGLVHCRTMDSKLLHIFARRLFDWVSFILSGLFLNEQKVPCRVVELAEYQGQNKQIRTSFTGLELQHVKK